MGESRRRRFEGVRASALACALAALLPAACGAVSPSPEQQDRSEREFQLAAALLQEGNVPGAMQGLDRALELNPSNAEAYALKAQIYLDRGEHAAAEPLARQAIRLLVEAGDRPSVLAEAHNLLGVILLHQERYDEAIAELRTSATDLHNRTPYTAWGNLGWALLDHGKPRESLDALREAVRIQRRFCLGHFLMGRAHLALEELAEAEGAFTLALEADERCMRFQDAWRLRGETVARLGRRDDALRDFQRCVELEPSSEAGQACGRFLEE